MKRIVSTVIVCLFVMLNAPALASEWPVDLEIREKMFLTQITELTINTTDYLGKTISMEGIFTSGTYGVENEVYYLVYRQSPGCCGTDGISGLEVIWDDPAATYPSDNDWVRAIGALEEYEEDGMAYMRLRLKALDVLPERGLEFVTQ